MLWLCRLLSERPDSLAGAEVTGTPCAVRVGVAEARAGQELWMKSVAPEVRASVLVEEATLSGLAVGKFEAGDWGRWLYV